ncbi:MAG: MTAP family purine nucleoside phosphorylase [Syntrophobacterales bacterium]|nr:MAG: MTAP family purine nucleoside phosphorylase [Syntrophobacterales bacterium]
MAKTGVIAGTAFRRICLSENANPLEVSTRFGKTTVLESDDIVFLPRHGMEDNIPPHRINHRVNLSAFKELGIPRIIGVNSVGSLKAQIPPKTILIPHDYINLWGIQTLFDHEIHHITPGLDEDFRQLILRVAKRRRIEVTGGGIYIQTTGPRLETRAEIQLLRHFGDVVGMTMGNEATLSEELSIPYASICSVDNYCHGISKSPLAAEEILRNARSNMEKVKRLVLATIEEVT